MSPEERHILEGKTAAANGQAQDAWKLAAHWRAMYSTAISLLAVQNPERAWQIDDMLRQNLADKLDS